MGLKPGESLWAKKTSAFFCCAILYFISKVSFQVLLDRINTVNILKINVGNENLLGHIFEMDLAN